MSAKDWRMPSPCGNCPFNASGPGLRLRKSRRRWPEILSGLRRGENFSCHKTTQHDDVNSRSTTPRICTAAPHPVASHVICGAA